MHSFRSTNWFWWCLLRRVLQHWTGSAAGAGRPLVVEVVAVAGSAALLVGRGNSLMTEFCSLHFLHGLGAAAGGGETLLTRSRGGPGHGTLRWTRASEQAGKALRSQGHQCAHVM